MARAEQVAHETLPEQSPPGWYPDPRDPLRQAWWDGERWHLSDETAATPVQTKEAKKLEKQRQREQRKAEAQGLREAQARQREEARQRAEEERREREFAASPPGRARYARSTGQRYFQVTLPIENVDRSWWAKATHDMSSASINVADTGDHVGATLTTIEDEGWELVEAGFTFRQTAEASRDKLLASGQQTTITGQTLGVYLFRARQDHP